MTNSSQSQNPITGNMGREGVPTNVPDLRVLHDVLVHGEGGDPEESAGHNHGDDAGHPSEHAEGQ